MLLLFLLARCMLRAAPGEASPDATLVAAVAAALLALHPVQSGSVLYIQGRPGLLSTVFALAAALAAVAAIQSWTKRGRRVALVATAVGLTALAALSKESAAVLPALVLLADLSGLAGGERGGLRARLVRLHLPLWLALLPLALAYATLQNPHGGVFGFGTVDAARFYATQPLVLLLYLRLYLWPAGLAVDRDMPLRSFAEPQVWVAALVLIVLLALVARAWRRAPWVAFWAAWWLAAVAPTSLVPNREFVAERYLTAATPAAAALAAALLAWLAARLAPRLRFAPRALTLALAIALALPLGWATRGRAKVWRSDLALWREATVVSPGNARAWYQVGRLLFADGENAPGRRRRCGAPSRWTAPTCASTCCSRTSRWRGARWTRPSHSPPARWTWARTSPGRTPGWRARWPARAAGRRRGRRRTARCRWTPRRATRSTCAAARGRSRAISPARRPTRRRWRRAAARRWRPRRCAGSSPRARAGPGRRAPPRAGAGRDARRAGRGARLAGRAAHPRGRAGGTGRHDEAVESWTLYLEMADAARWDRRPFPGSPAPCAATGRAREADSVMRRARAAGRAIERLQPAPAHRGTPTTPALPDPHALAPGRISVPIAGAAERPLELGQVRRAAPHALDGGEWRSVLSGAPPPAGRTQRRHSRA